MQYQDSAARRAAGRVLPPRSLAADATTEAFAGIFERVLQIGPIEADADFFALGGDSITAAALVLEIEEATGITLPLTLLFDAPTPALLARAVEEFAIPNQRPIVPVKRGNGAPLFLIPGTGGSVMSLGSLAKRLGVSNPVYGFQAPGVDGRQPPLDRIEAMADIYLPLIHAVQPHGPYLFGGYSMGGLVALELAQRLISAGEAVPLLVFFDTFIHPKRLSASRKLRIWLRRIQHHMAILRQRHWSDAVPYALGRVRGILDDLGIGAARSPGQPRASDPAVSATTRLVIEAALQAVAHYRPRFYPGTITFLQAEDPAVPNYPEITWRGMARKLVVQTTEGDHWSMVRTDRDNTAQKLSECIRAALTEP